MSDHRRAPDHIGDVTNMIRCGDHVRHQPTREDWVVAFADYETGDLCACGWPESLARIADCTLVKIATDAEHAALVRAIIKSGGMRASKVARLYPEAGAHA